MDLDNTIQPEIKKAGRFKSPVTIGQAEPSSKFKAPVPIDTTSKSSKFKDPVSIESPTPEPTETVEEVEIDPIRRKEKAGEKLKDIDSNLNDLRKQEKSLVKQLSEGSYYLPGVPSAPVEIKEEKELAEVRDKIAGLKIERLKVKRNANPIDESTMKDIADKTSFSVDENGNLATDFKSALLKYPISTINDAYNSYYTDQYKQQADKNAKAYMSAKDPAYMFTYNGFNHAPVDDIVKSLSKDEVKALTDLWVDITKGPSWNGYNKVAPVTKADRIKTAVDALKLYVDGKFSDQEPDFRKNKVFEYSKYLGKLFFYDNKDGKPSLEGMQAYAEDQLFEINDRLRETNGIYQKLHKLSVQGKLNGQDEYLEYINNERLTLEALKTINEDIINTPSMRSGLGDVVGMFSDKGAIGSTNWSDLLSLGFNEARRLKEIKGISKKVENGDFLSWSEQKLLETYSTLEQAAGKGTKGVLYQTLEASAEMIPYIASFGVTKKLVYDPVNKLVGSAMKKVIPESLVKKGFDISGTKLGKVIAMNKISPAKIIQDWTPKLVGAAVQTAAQPQYIKSAAFERMIPETSVDVDDEQTELITTLDKNSGVKEGEAWLKGFATAYGEFATEHAGSYLTKFRKTFGRSLNTMVGRPIPEKYFIDQSLKLFGHKKASDTFKAWAQSTLGWHGAVEEYTEELANQIFTSITTGDGFGSGRQFLEQQLVTALTVGVVGLPINLTNTATNAIKYKRYGLIGDEVGYIKTDNEGNKSIVKLPGEVHDKLLKIFNQDNLYVDGTAIDDLIEEHITTTDQDKKLSKEQVNFILDLAMQEGQKKYVRQRLIQSLNQSGIKTEECIDQPQADDNTEEVKKEGEKLLKKKDIDKILKGDKKIAKEYPDLYSNGLLARDNTGQLLEPTPDFLLSISEQLDEEIKDTKDKVKLDQLIYQKSLVTNTLDDLADKLSVPFNYREPSKKHEILSDRLRKGEKLEGTVSLTNSRTLLLTLKDGQQVNAFMGSLPGVNETEEQYKDRVITAQRAGRKHFPVTLELQAKEDWNPNDEVFEVIENKYTGQKTNVPYGDRINVISEGKVIAAVQVHDYGIEKIKADKYKKLVDMTTNAGKDIVHNLVIENGEEKESEKEKEKLLKTVYDLIYDVNSNLNLDYSESLEWIINQINSNPRFNDFQKQKLIEFIEANRDNISQHIQTTKFSQRGYKTKISELNLSEFEYATNEAVGQTARQKLDDQLKKFTPIWNAIADEFNIHREDVELGFYKISQFPSFSSVTNKDTYINWLSNLETKNENQEAIKNFLLRETEGELDLSYDQMRSAFNFYRNVKLVKQFGKIIDDSGIHNQDLNPAQRYEQFIEKFISKIKSMDILRVRSEISDLRRKRDARFMHEVNFTPEERSKALHDQHEDDLRFLNYITDIPVDTWRTYFNEQTKETRQLTEPRDKSWHNFGSYEELLNSVAYRQGREGKYWLWRQSNLMFNLIRVLEPIKEDNEFTSTLIKFFTKGSEDAKGKTISLSNLYKLSTSLDSEEPTGAYGVDVKGDNFSSFQQYSDLFYTADHILSSSIENNSVVDYYKSIGKPIEIVIFDGLHNRKVNKDEEGTPSSNLSMTDIWIVLMSNFAEGKETYLQNIGQFADKPYLYAMQVKKTFIPTAEEISVANGLINGKFDEVVKHFVEEVAYPYKKLFADMLINFPSDVPESDTVNHINDKINNFMRSFVYNYIMNQKDVNEIFFGDQKSYKSVEDLFKRAGSTNSPGYVLDTNVDGGVGKTFRMAVINEKAAIGKDGKMLTDKALDGCVFFSDNVGKKIQVSMGDIFARKKAWPTMTTMKALMSWKNSVTNKRGLIKGNWYNIETLWKDSGSEVFKAIRDFMKENNIDVVSMGSSSSVKKLDEGEEVKFFDKDGKIIENIEFNPDVHVKNKSWENVFVQQDLRHSINPKTSKAPSQNITTLLSLDSSSKILSLIYQSQKNAIDQIMSEFRGETSDLAKKQWLIENVNKHTQQELLDLLNMGLTVDDPVYRNMMRKIIASAVKRKALEIPINRTVLIEIPDADGYLDPMTKVIVDGKEHSLLPDCAASIPGGRTFNYRFIGKPDEAIAFVKENAHDYRDLFDENGNLMEWEIRGRNGVIPGEVVFLTRVPNSGFSTFDVARLKVNFPTGNFAMINRVGQVASSSDFDGDMRFVQSFYKREGLVFFDDTSEGIANQVMMQVVQSYSNPKYFNLITKEIDTNAYDDIVKSVVLPSYPQLDPRAYQSSRLNNKVGLDMKGGMTNLLTVFSIISRYKIPFRRTRTLYFNDNNKLTTFRIDRVVKDEFGAVRANMENFLTMFFDNQKDPKVEKMGFNEITGNMFILMLIGSSENSSDILNASGKRKFNNFNDHYKYIIEEYLPKQVKYFTSPLMRDFIAAMRTERGAMESKDEKKVFRNLKKSKKYSEDELKNLRILFNLAKELTDIKALHSLTQEVPDTYADFVKAKRLVSKAKTNNPTDGFRLFDLKNLFDERGNFVNELKIIDDVIQFANDFIFDDIVDTTNLGQQIYDYVFQLLSERELNVKEDPEEPVVPKKALTDREINSISATLNNIFNIRAIGIKSPFSVVQARLLGRIPELKKEFPGNLFLEFVEISDNNVVRVKQEFRNQKILDRTLNAIRDDFDMLPDDAKDLFATYQLEKYGSSTVTSNGGFYLLFGPKYKVELSRKAREEMDAWYFDEIDPMERLAIAQWVLRGNRSYQIRSLQKFVAPEDRLVDFVTDATLSIPVHRDTLEGVVNIDDVTEFNKIHGQKGFNAITDDLFALAAKLSGNPVVKSYGYLKESLRPRLAKYLSERRQFAETLFPKSSPATDEELKDMYADDPNMSAIMSFDANLNNAIFSHLRKKFPGIRHFNDRQSFYDYVRRNTSRAININLDAVGHAFRDAVFVDPSKPIQEAMFHEYSHIYWDSLPEDNPIKEKLRRLYYDHYGPQAYESEWIDEKIIRDIGRAGTDYVEKYIDSSILDKFLSLLQDFWREVKIFFGKYEKTDLVNEMVRHIWDNKDRINPNSNQAEQEIKNLVIADNDVNNIIGDDVKHQYRIGNIRLAGVTSVIDRFKYNKFDASKTLQEKVTAFEKFWKTEIGEDPTDEDIYYYTQSLETDWADRARTGSVIHSVAEEVFGGKQIEQDIIDSNFNGDTAEKLRKSFRQLRDEILLKYPDAVFYTEKAMVSMKYKIFGYGDLIVDVGNNKLLVFDFKTTDEEYKDSEGNLSRNYLREFGFMMPPLTKIRQSKKVTHQLQLSIEAKILEEQTNSLNPGEKNTIEGLFIVPVISRLKNGKIDEAHISDIVKVPGVETESGAPLVRAFDNIIQVDYAEPYAVDMMNKYNASIVDVDELYMELESKIEKSDVPFPVANKILEAYSYLTKATGKKLNELTYDDMEVINTNGFRGLYNKLLALEYSVDDINTMSFEILLNVAEKNITRVEWEASKHVHMVKVPVSAARQLVQNPKWKENSNPFYHLEIDGKDHYFHEAGYHNARKGDQVILIRDIDYEHKDFRHVSYHTIEKIGRKGKFVDLRDQNTGRLQRIHGISEREGIHIIDEKPHIPERNVVKNNFVPRFIEKKVIKYEEHWEYGRTKESFGNTSEGEKAFRMHDQTQHLLWKFFSEYNTKQKVIALLKDKDTMKELFSKLYELRTEQSEASNSLMKFLRDGLMNHIMAEQIVFENQNGPQPFMPMTLNLYKIITNANDAIYKDFTGYNSFARFLHPSRKLNAQYVAIDWILTGLDLKLVEVHKEQYDLNEKIKKYFTKLNSKRLTVRVGKRLEWRYPETKGLTQEESDFLRLIYDHYYKRVPFYIAKGKEFSIEGRKVGVNGYPIQIPVTKVHATKQEVRNTVGKKGSKMNGLLRWGSIIYDIMADNTYDRIKFKIDDKLVTLEEIKDQFAIENLNDEQIKEWLGNRGQYFFRHIPFLRNIWTKGTLYSYYTRARKIYHRGDKYNAPAETKGYLISGITSRKLKYQTDYIMESEAKVMESNIFAYHMKEMIAPLDYIMAGYKKTDTAFKYLKEYTDLVMFHRSDDLGTEVTALTDALQQLTSLRFISFSPKTQFYNLLVGQSMNFVRESGAYMRGLKRIVKDGKENGIAKAINILRSHGLGDIVDEARFDTLAKRAGVDFRWGDKGFNVSAESFKTAGFFMMEVVERLNQFPIFVGLMTDQEWESYNVDGSRKPGMDGMSFFRATIISERVRDIHGDYTTKNAAPMWNTNIGAMVMQFFKWAPTSLDATIMPYHFTRQYMIRSGILPSVVLALKLTSFKVFISNDEKKRYEHLRKALLRWPEASKVKSYNEWVKKTFSDPKERNKWMIDLKKIDESVKEKQSEYLNGVNDYMKMLIVASEEGRVTYKQLNEQDRRNLMSALFKSLLFVAIKIFINMNEGDSDEEKAFDSEFNEIMMRILTRYQSDIFLIAGEASTATGTQQGGMLLQKLQKPIPSVDILVRLVQFNTNFWPATADVAGKLATNTFGPDDEYMRQWWRPDVGIYKRDSRNVLAGDPKAIFDFISLMPSGSAINWVLQSRVKSKLNQPFLESLREMNIPEEMVSQYARYITEDMKVKDVKKLADQMESIKTVMKNAAVMDAIDGNEVMYRDVVNGTKIFTKTNNIFKDAAGMLQYLNEYKLNPEKLDSLIKRSDEFIEMMKEGSNQTDAEKIRRYLKAVEYIKSHPGLFNSDITSEELDPREPAPAEEEKDSVFNLFRTKK